MKRKRTTHSDLANLVDDIETRLAALPSIIVGVNDSSTRVALKQAAASLYAQDVRIDRLVVAIRLCRQAKTLEEARDVASEVVRHA